MPAASLASGRAISKETEEKETASELNEIKGRLILQTNKPEEQDVYDELSSLIKDEKITEGEAEKIRDEIYKTRKDLLPIHRGLMIVELELSKKGFIPEKDKDMLQELLNKKAAVLELSPSEMKEELDETIARIKKSQEELRGKPERRIKFLVPIPKEEDAGEPTDEDVLQKSLKNVPEGVRDWYKKWELIPDFQNLFRSALQKHYESKEEIEKAHEMKDVLFRLKAVFAELNLRGKSITPDLIGEMIEKYTPDKNAFDLVDEL